MGRRKSGGSSAGFGVLILLGGILALFGAAYRFAVENSAAIIAFLAVGSIVALLGFLIFSRKSKGQQLQSQFTSEPSATPISIERFASFSSTTRKAKATWILPGQQISIQNFQISDGLFYFGESVALDRSNASGQYAINGKLPVARGQSDTAGASMSYWPSYASITPQARRAFLEWMAGGRSNPSYGIGYVFLFFYGIEHRLFIDRDFQGVEPLVAEVERLLLIYGSNNSFNGYANSFLTFAKLAAGVSLGPPRFAVEGSGSNGIDAETRIYLGRRLAITNTFAAEDALLWVLALPDVYLRTPAVRCFDEFALLWALRFNQKYPKGFAVKVPTKKIDFRYRAASGAFEVEVPGEHEQYPDIAAVKTSTNVLVTLVQSCTEELEPFSRFVGRKPEARATMQAAILLPNDLLQDKSVGAFRSFGERIDAVIGTHGRASTTMREVIKMVGFDVPADGKVTSALGDQLGNILDRIDVAIEPDRRYGSGTPQLDDKVFLFKAAGGGPVDQDRPPYRSMKAQVEVSVLAAAADGEASSDELREVIAVIRAGVALTGVEQARLIAFAVTIFESPPKQARVLRRLTDRTVEEKQAIANAAIAAVGAGENVKQDEVRFLERLHKSLGLPSDGVYSGLHRTTKAPDEPVPITVEKRVSGIPIPKQTETAAIAAASVRIDAGRLAQVQKETQAVSDLLTQIFVEDAETATNSSPADLAVDSASAFWGLDEAHAELVEYLEIKVQITRQEFEERARYLKLLPDGAIEKINDWAFDRFDEPLLEDGEQVIMDARLRSRLAELREAAT